MPKYLFRLLSFSFILAAVPVSLIGIISYIIASGDIEDKVKEGNMQVLLQTQMRVEQALKTLELTSLQFVNSPTVTSSLNEELGYDDFSKLRDLSKGLYNLQTFTSVREAYFVNLNKDWMVSFSIFRKFSTYPGHEQFASYAKYPNSLFWITKSPKTDEVAKKPDIAKIPDEAAETDDGSGGETSSSSPPALRMVYKIPVIPMTSQPKGLLIVEILNSQVKALLSNNKKLGDVSVLDSEGQNFLLDDSETDSNAEIHALVAEKVRETGEDSGFFNAYVHDEELGVTYRSSSYNGWIYVSVVSIEDITKQSKKIAWVTFIACTVIFILVALVAFYGSRRMYSPIKRLFEFTKDIQVEGQEHKDEFDSIEQRFRTLFSTEQQLQQQVKGQFTQLKEFFVLKLFTGQLSDGDLAYRSQMFGFPTEWNRLGVITVQIDTLQEGKYRDHDKELLLFAINNMVGELIAQQERFSPILLEQSQVTLLICNLEDDAACKEYFFRTAEMIREKIREYLHLPISIGISRPFDRATEASRAYGECLEALKCRISLGNEIIIHYDDIDAGKKDMEMTVYTQLKLLEDQLINAVKLGDTERVDGVFDKYIGVIVEKGIHFNEYPVLMMQLISKAFQLVQEQGGAVKKVLGDKATIDHFIKLSTLEEIVKWFKVELFEPIIGFLNTQAESQYVNIANQMVKLVHERFDQEISLEACATILSFHPVYLSRVFKKEMGINFSEYLAEYRMNMAKTWLETTNLKISEIAEKLNYTNTTAFIRTFRKIVGMTPGQYRDQYNKK
ncbi:helix-turn-helix domain-containing protein [Paenibacillus doosanensis]|uniref:helix-turn-helix domain-containing protein n=1 Tax=Paenibacillus doosanensis TaxID=1229154 RepID=UPI00217FBF26|nr:helix-turn-helix domain-containing protein [Paenibacillus doosanensis]MCS7463507.1 helix-turn-helix domain-containing protein [Paenibacillus doosanensis]